MASVSSQQLKNLNHALCCILTDHASDVDWVSFTAEDWDLLGKFALQQDVGPLVYWQWKEFHPAFPTPPDHWLEPLRASYYATLARNTLIFQTLWKILSALDAKHIPVIVLKGASLVGDVYPDAGLRPMGDLDLLFHREDVPAASEALRLLGLMPVVMEDESNPEFLNIYAQTFTGDDCPVMVELHWNLFGGSAYRYEPAPDYLWSNSQILKITKRTRIDAGEFRILIPSMNFLYLSAHLALKHRGVGELLRWYVDLYKLIRTGKLDWTWLVNVAHDLHWDAGLVVCLEGLVQDFAVELPPGYLQQVRAKVQAQDWEYIQQRGEIKSNWQKISVTLQPLPWHGRLRFLWGAAFPDVQYMRWRYHPSPSWLWPLMYPYRWMRSIQKLIFNAPDTPPPVTRK